MSLINVFKILKMFYNFLCYISTFFRFLFNIIWLCCTFASAGIPWFTLLFVFIYILSKFIKLKIPPTKCLFALFGDDSFEDTASNLYWPIANRGGAFDAPENSAAALKKVNNIIQILLTK